jgi:hypothetical protein
MSELKINKTNNSPLVNFDTSNQQYALIGVSSLLTAVEFFSGVGNWIAENKDLIEPNSEWHFYIPYFNSGSAKGILHVMLVLKKSFPDNDPRIVWYLEDDDDFMLESGKSFESILEIPFVYRSFLLAPKFEEDK